MCNAYIYSSGWWNIRKNTQYTMHSICDERLHNVSFSRHSKHNICSATPPKTAEKPLISKHLRSLQYHRVFLHQRPNNYMIRISPQSLKPHASSLILSVLFVFPNLWSSGSCNNGIILYDRNTWVRDEETPLSPE